MSALDPHQSTPSLTRFANRKRIRSSILHQPVPTSALLLTRPHTSSSSTSLSAGSTSKTSLAMDTDPEYYPGHSSPQSLWAGLGLWPEKDHDEMPLRKRRRGVAGAILSTALDAALFTSAVGYAAYQIWCGKPLDEGPEDTRRQFIQTPPPPYEPCDPRRRPRPTKRPSVARQPTRVHQPRPSPNPTPRRVRTPAPAPVESDLNDFNFVLRPHEHAKQQEMQARKQDDLMRDLSGSLKPYERPAPADEDDPMSDFVCSLKPYERPATVEPEEDEDEEDDDEQMRAFKAQIRGLINDGHAALATRPELPTPTREISRPTAITPVAASAPATVAAVAAAKLSKDEDIKILQKALEQASIGSRKNWWELSPQRH